MTSKSINWETKVFDELSIYELYEILKLRAEVFVVEQNCHYQDLDDIDKRCFHLLGWREDKLAAYARVIPPGASPYELQGEESNANHGSIGRVAVLPAFRGIGHELVVEALKTYDRHIGKETTCIIHAQAHLQRFYEKHGFKRISDIYLIDKIEHVEMIREI